MMKPTRAISFLILLALAPYPCLAGGTGDNLAKLKEGSVVARRNAAAAIGNSSAASPETTATLVAALSGDSDPIVVARNKHVEGKLNVMIYGHYDVQPVDPVELWDSDPFSADIRGDNLYARGATDMKGQLMASLFALEAIKENQQDSDNDTDTA